MLLLFGTRDPRTIVAGVTVLRLTPIGADVRRSLTISAGVAVLRLTPETARVTLAPTVVAPGPPTAAETLAAQLATSHAPRARIVTLTTSRAVITAYNPAAIMLDGSVTEDRTREVRRTASLRLVDEDGSLAPTAAGDEFAPGELLRIDRGVQVSGKNIYTLLGVFEIRSFDADLAGTLSLRVEDPSLALRQDFGEVNVIPAGTSAEDALRTLWEPVIGTGDWDLDGDAMAVGVTRTFDEDDERLHSAVALMSDLGLEVYMGRNGYPVLRPFTDPNDDEIAHTYRQLPGEALVTRLARTGDQQPFNRMVVIGDNPDAPSIRAVADITDPTSPWHRDRIGLRVAPIHRSAQITTQHQGNTVARARLIEQSMWSDSVRVRAVADPTVRAGKVVRVVEPQTGTSAKYRIDRVTNPVVQGSMSFDASRVVPLFGEGSTSVAVTVPALSGSESAFNDEAFSNAFQI